MNPYIKTRTIANWTTANECDDMMEYIGFCGEALRDTAKHGACKKEMLDYLHREMAKIKREPCDTAPYDLPIRYISDGMESTFSWSICFTLNDRKIMSFEQAKKVMADIIRKHYPTPPTL